MEMLRRAAGHAAAPWLALVIAVAAAHGGSLGNGFVWDDAEIIVENPVTRDLSRLGEVMLSPDQTAPYYRPLNRASYLIDHALYGMSAPAFHAVSLLVHAASVLLLFALGRRLFGATSPALIAAALLAVHPIHTESVSFVAARNNLFALAFALATLVLFVDATRRRSRARAWLSGAAFFLGLASKEQAAMVLPVAVALLFVPGTSAAWRGWRAWRSLVPHACALGAYLVLRSIALGGMVGAGSIAHGLLARVAQNAWVMPRYLWLAVWPARLTNFHAAIPPSGAPEVAAIGLTWIAVAAGVVVLVRRPTLASTMGLVWLVANLVPIANLVSLPATAPMAERYFHAPAVGLWIIAADVARRLAEGDERRRRIVLAAAAVALLALSVRTMARTRDWHDDLVLARSAVATSPRAVAAWFNLGVVLKDRGDLDGAERAWRSALSVDPRNAGSLMQLGTAAAIRGDYAQAERLLRAAVDADPGLAEAHLNLGRICDRTGRPAEALREYEAGLALVDRPEQRQPDVVARVRQLRR